MFLNVILVLLTIAALSAAFWQFTARNRPLFAIFSIEGPAVIEQTIYARMKLVLRNWGGVPAQNSIIKLDVIAAAHNKPRQKLSWTKTINGPVYPGQEFSLQPDLDFRDLIRQGYKFRLIANVSCHAAVPLALRQLSIVRMLSHSQKQVWDWDENQWKLMGTELNDLQPAAE